MRHNNKSLIVLPAALLAAAVVTPAQAATLDDVKSSGEFTCGVSTGLAGFSSPDENGKWTGIDVEVCRAVAAAVLGDGARRSLILRQPIVGRRVDIVLDLPPTGAPLDRRATPIDRLPGVAVLPQHAEHRQHATALFLGRAYWRR